MGQARLKIEGQNYSDYRIWLDDQEVTQFTKSVSVDLSVDDPNTAALTVHLGRLELDADVDPQLIAAAGKERTSFVSRFRTWVR